MSPPITTSPAKTTTPCRNAAAFSVRPAASIDISFEWVRGHNGHALNELADRLAVLARRNQEMGVDEVTNARMVAAVREDAKIIVAGLGSTTAKAAA